jgi:acetyl-CoA synthetase
VSIQWKIKSTPSIIWQRWSNEKSRILDEYQSKRVLNKIGINVPEGFIIKDKNSLLNKFRTIKKAVALKAMGINHKTDVSGVVLGIDNENELLNKFNNMKRVTKSKEFLIEHQVDNCLVELLVGIVRDPQHGFMITIAEGGVLSELRKDSVTLCMPCNKTEIARALKKLKIWPLLNGYRNKKTVNINKIILAVLALQRYALKERDKLVELEINPLLVKSNQVVAADALIKENY